MPQCVENTYPRNTVIILSQGLIANKIHTPLCADGKFYFIRNVEIEYGDIGNNKGGVLYTTHYWLA